jgi:hypothetical protein
MASPHLIDGPTSKVPARTVKPWWVSNRAEPAVIIEGAKQDRHNIGLRPADRVLAARFKSGLSIRRRKWGPALAAVFIVLCLAWSGVSMLVGPPLEIADDAYRSALAEGIRQLHLPGRPTFGFEDYGCCNKNAEAPRA